MNTLLLDTVTWDLVLDVNGNIAVAAPPYATAQDVASAVRTFLGECWYDTTLGVPYFQQVLGQFPSLAQLKSMLIKAAAAVPGCYNPVCYISSVSGRTVQGQIQFTDSAGNAQVVAF